ncbi:MAG: ATP-dependent helicase HrpB [Ketobacteraceae bacterium]|nr:ATP-dependent helicase HrpB [Ketobacteraceae bacterium]
MALPIETCLPVIENHLTHCDRLVIQAPPGAGKTTLVPLHLLSGLGQKGRILLIQPRRLAVYGAAYRMADMRNEKPGSTIGYTTRFDRKTTADTRIEVVTEGIFLRMIQQDPELGGISTVIFDEFHERSVTNDLALAFALESQQAFRDAATPLKLIIMSATLDGNLLSEWLGAPLVCSEGRLFPVDTFYRPQPRQTTIETHVADMVCEALTKHDGSLLVFLPGMREIRRVHDQLEQRSPEKHIVIYPLHASLPHNRQQQAIAPAAPGQRKIVLTTNVAETSVTIEGIRVVIDSGLVKTARYDERRGLNVLLTEKISAASAEQRRGRAGRVMAGVCYRAWSAEQQTQLKAFREPEILHTDLLPVALELAVWGCNDSSDLQLLTPPDPEALKRAQATLEDMGAIHGNGVITATGQQMAAMGLHPRPGLLIACSSEPHRQSAAVATAALLSEGDPLRFPGQWPQADLGLRLALWHSTRSIAELHQSSWQRLKKLTLQLARRAGYEWQPDTLTHPDNALGLAHAFPDRVAQLRKNSQQRYLMANGKGVQLNPEDRLGGSEYLVVLDAMGNDREPFIRLACPLDASQMEQALGDHFTTDTETRWNPQKQAAESLETVRFHHLIIRQTPCDPADPEALSRCLLEGIQRTGLCCLPWTTTDHLIRGRIAWLKATDTESWPDWSDAGLEQSLKHWLLPYLAGMRRLSDLQQLCLHQILAAQLTREQQANLEKQAPGFWELPTGQQKPIVYDPEKGPVLRARMQELYGITSHPVIGSNTPLLIEILSPADRPIQVTSDLPGFWEGSYTAVAREMRGRYPKHFWPDNPGSAQATTKTKRHMN